MAAEGETEEDAEDDAGGERGDIAVGGVDAGDQSVAAGLDLVDLLESERFAGHDVRGCARCVVVAEGEVVCATARPDSAKVVPLDCCDLEEGRCFHCFGRASLLGTEKF